MDDLSPGDRDTLQRLARSRQTPHGVAARARLVVDCADLGVMEAARRSSVTRTTATKWSRRFRDLGVDGLWDSPRSGRPSMRPDLVERVLGCSLDEPPDGAERWTTRTIAEAAGVSQATVSRIRRRHIPAWNGDAPLLDGLSAVLVHIDVGPIGCALGLQAAGGSTQGARASAARVDVVETIVCAALLARPVLDDSPRRRDAGHGSPAVELLRRAAEKLSGTSGITLVIDAPVDPEAKRWLSQHPDLTVCGPKALPASPARMNLTVRYVAPQDWLTLVSRVADSIDSRQLAELRAVQQQIRQARRNAATQFTWSRSVESSPGPASIPTIKAGTEPPAGDLTYVVRALCDEVLDGELRFGDPISGRRVARRAAVSPGRVAEALNQLADEALIDRQPGRYLLPVPAPRDVIETYTARGLLGTAIARRLASTRADLPTAVDEHFAGIVRCNELRLPLECGELDLALQDELARASDMPRIGSMFIRLSLQLRIFIAIFGLNYRYPTDQIVADNSRILFEIRRHDPDAAVDAWRGKIDNAARYMLTHLRAVTGGR